jgi:hypothetical protein
LKRTSPIRCHIRHKAWDSAFITYAGPWAEARTQWTEHTLDGEDDDGDTFNIYVLAAFLRNTHGDGDDYRRARAADPWAALAEREGIDREQIWNGELEERAWPVIQQAAALLMSGPVAADTIRALLEQRQPAGALDADRS